jgi:hypothetical protein
MDSPHAVHAPGPGTPWQQHAPARHAGHNPALWGAIWLDYSYEVGSLAAYCGIGGEW